MLTDSSSFLAVPLKLTRVAVRSFAWMCDLTETLSQSINLTAAYPSVQDIQRSTDGVNAVLKAYIASEEHKIVDDGTKERIRKT